MHDCHNSLSFYVYTPYIIHHCYINKIAIYTAPGSEVCLLDIGPLKVGLTVCYDLRFPELYQLLAFPPSPPPLSSSLPAASSSETKAAIAVVTSTSMAAINSVSTTTNEDLLVSSVATSTLSTTSGVRKLDYSVLQVPSNGNNDSIDGGSNGGVGADIILVPAAFTVRTGQAHWLTLLKARAIENQVYIVAAAQAGSIPLYRMYL